MVDQNTKPDELLSAEPMPERVASRSLELSNAISPEDERLEQAEYLTMIAKGVETLSNSDRMILYLRFGRDLTQSEIASRIGTSQMQVSRLLRAAIEKIRKVSGETGRPPSS